jgi:hypothetical protein
MDSGPFIALGVMTVLLLTGNWLWPTSEKHFRRELEAYPEALVSKASGAVRVTGRIRCAAELLSAPLSGRACIGYEIVVEAKTGAYQPYGLRPTSRLVAAREVCPFLLTDESGTARVDTSGPLRLGLLTDYVGVTDGDYPGKHQALSVLLESKGVVATDSLGCWARLRYAESVIADDQLVCVGGPSNREVDPTGDRSGPRVPPLRLVLRGTEAQPLLIAAVNTKT